MTTKLVEVQRFSVISAKPFKDVLAKLDAAIGHPNMAAFRNDLTARKLTRSCRKSFKKRLALQA